MNILGRFFKQPTQTVVQTVYQIVEVEKPVPVPPLDENSSQAVATLQAHPGFQYLLAKLRLQRSALKTILTTQRQHSLTDVEFIQSGIAWTGWLEEQLNAAIGFKAAPPTDSLESQRIAFEEALGRIEILRGSSTDEQTA